MQNTLKKSCFLTLLFVLRGIPYVGAMEASYLRDDLLHEDDTCSTSESHAKPRGLRDELKNNSSPYETFVPRYVFEDKTVSMNDSSLNNNTAQSSYNTTISSPYNVNASRYLSTVEETVNPNKGSLHNNNSAQSSYNTNISYSYEDETVSTSKGSIKNNTVQSNYNTTNYSSSDEEIVNTSKGSIKNNTVHSNYNTTNYSSSDDEMVNTSKGSINNNTAHSNYNTTIYSSSEDENISTSKASITNTTIQSNYNTNISSLYNVTTRGYASTVDEYSSDNHVYQDSSSSDSSHENASSSSEDSSSNSENSISTNNPYYYTVAFDSVLKMLGDSNKDTQESNILWEKLDTIGDAFVNDAINYGRIIIKERKLPIHLKTIQPANLGGIAGGDKYIVQGILFKFPKDQLMGATWLYGGNEASEYLAAKSAGQELLSANYVGSYSPSIKVPLMAVVDYWGSRLIATALLPIQNEYTLVYGSADAGQTILSKNETISETMNSLGRTLQLQPHMVGSTVMALCGDIEVHECRFNKREDAIAYYYCIDTARVFPPEFVRNKQKPQSIFYEKLRPEFVRRYSEPLSSGSFTGWQAHDKRTTE
ncbi:hypothetical protein H0W26_03615, partial [Candidatus Dependentiae bacterium]|nr:hypothetical protein [Candidatus Dependentiae bacterium]